MSDLETLLRSAAKSGRLNYISVGFSEGKWIAVYRGVENRDMRTSESTDIAAALIAAIGTKAVPLPVPKVPAAVTKAMAENERKLRAVTGVEDLL